MDQAAANNVDFMAAFRRRIDACRRGFLPPLLELMRLPWVYEPLCHLPGLPPAVSSMWKQIEDARVQANRLYAERTRAWKEKLAAAVAMRRMQGRDVALRHVLDVLKLVQGWGDPAVTLEALLDICEPLSELDRERAAAVADIAAKLARQLQRAADCTRAETLKAHFAQKPGHRAAPTTTVCA
jgi:hypothetical protein